MTNRWQLWNSAPTWLATKMRNQRVVAGLKKSRAVAALLVLTLAVVDVRAETASAPLVTRLGSFCRKEVWTPTDTTGAPAAAFHTAVWTGSEMIVWGGFFFSDVLNFRLDTGRLYDPAGDRWRGMTTAGAPTARKNHTAVWTGSKMIVWGGDDGGRPNAGGQYDPKTDSWTATATTGAPAGRTSHTAVWTGSKMIVWGGNDGSGYLNTGAQYDPARDSWTATSMVGAPTARAGHTAVWTGSKMIVWGGYDGSNDLNTGTQYDPATDSWTPTTTAGAPSIRTNHTAVWTGAEMVVWGGFHGGALDTGGQYDPATDSWGATATTGAPKLVRGQTAVWTGTEMLIWGFDSNFSSGTGGRYEPAMKRWTSLTTTGAPYSGDGYTVVWTGSEMIVWGGVVFYFTYESLSTGGRWTVLPLACGTSFYTVKPCRLLDTRRTAGSHGGPALSAGQERRFVLAGVTSPCGIPSTATAVAINAVAISPTQGPGFLTIYAPGTARPSTATLNYNAGKIRANGAIVQLGPSSGDIAVFCQQGSGSTDLVIDVTGYFE